MIYYSQKAFDDLDNIFYGLIIWPKHPLEPEHAKQYVRNIEEMCNSLDGKFYHQKTSYITHKKYGNYVYQYKRNQNTSWYIIYNKSLSNDIFIERIINNYLTID